MLVFHGFLAKGTLARLVHYLDGVIQSCERDIASTKVGESIKAPDLAILHASFPV